jgi:hypothetical protein
MVHMDQVLRAESISALESPLPWLLAKTFRILSRCAFLISSSTDCLFAGSDQTQGPCMVLRKADALIRVAGD